jgi:predicted ATPase
MARLQGIHIQNFRSLADVKIGQVKYASGAPLPAMACFIGPNGSGKSSLLDAFGFISHCLTDGIEVACDKPARGGFERLRTQGRNGPIKFELFFDDDDPDRPIVYALSIELSRGVPSVVEESLRQRCKGEKRGKPYYFLKLKNGKGKVWAGTYGEGDDNKHSERVLVLVDADQDSVAEVQRGSWS